MNDDDDGSTLSNCIGYGRTWSVNLNRRSIADLAEGVPTLTHILPPLFTSMAGAIVRVVFLRLKGGAFEDYCVR